MKHNPTTRVEKRVADTLKVVESRGTSQRSPLGN